MIHQLTYAGIGIYGVVLLCHAVRTRGSDLLEISSHLALVLFLGLLLRSLDDENVRKQIDTSTAILALSASLVSFVFGISIGKSWGMALAATAKSTRARDRDAGHDPKGSAEHYVVRPPQGGLATTLVSDFSRKERIFSDESVCSSKHATPSYTKGDPFKSRIQTAALLLSPSSRSETIDSFSGFNITQVFVDDTIDTLSTIVGASSKADAYKNKKWSLMTLSSNGSYLWTNADKRDGVMLKASTLSATPAHAVACWLLDRQIGTGLEGIMYRSETLLVNEKENICVQRFVCKSERVLLSSRCFLVVTAWRRLGDGSFIIVTRSVPPDVGKGLDKKSVRGCVYASGFLIRTLPEAAEGRSTELLFGVHISFSRSGKSNIDKAKLDEISKCISNSLSQAAVGAADPYNISEQGIESTEAEDRDSLELSQKQRSEVLSVARDTLVKLAHLHHTAPRGDLSAGILQFGCIPHVQADSSEVESGGSNWNDIYNFDGISVSERSDERKTIGTLRATCMIDAPPSVIHDLLTKHSEVIDSLVEQKMVLAQLNSTTSLQWIAYGSVWPVGAFDFLVVTVDEICTTSKGDTGFVIVSTSVDGILDEEEVVVEMDDSDGVLSDREDDKKPSFRSDKSKYSRSSLKMAGYVGQPNGLGGTELTLHLDLDLYAYIPAWLMQLLAQNGLSEMMGRLRQASVLMSQGQNPVCVATTSKIGSMLSQIQVREEKLRSLKCSEDGFRDKQLVAETAERKRNKNADFSRENGALSSVSDDTVSAGPANISCKVLFAKSHAVDVDALQKMDLTETALKRLMIYIGKKESPDFPLDWTQKLVKNGICISSTVIVNSTWNALKADLMVNADIDILRKLLVDDSRVGEYDDMFDSCEMICRLSDHSAVRRMTFKAVWPTQPRDFIVCTSWSQLDDGSVAITTISVPDEICPPKEGFVRGTVNISGYLINPVTSAAGMAALNVTLCLHTDLGGSLPVGIINMLATSAPIKMLTTISQIARQESSRIL